MFISNLSRALLILTIFLLFNFTLLSDIGISQQKSDNTSIDSLETYITRANTLWGEKKSDLQLAVNLLAQVSKKQAQPYYGLATNFYYWSLKKAAYHKEQETIKDELERIKPLVPDSTQDKWTELFENKDKQLLNELAGFWEINDPYVTTKVNERLIEHWQRIDYARKHFTKAIQSPYGTDERGIFYVRLGAPSRLTQKNLQLNYVIGPEGRSFDFELGNVIQSDIEIWKYPDLGEDFFLLFGNRNGWGEFGLRKRVMELIPEDIRVQIRGSGFISYSKMKKLSENVALYDVMQQLAPYHSFFQQMYSNMETNLSAYSLGYTSTDKFRQAAFITEPLTNLQIYENVSGAPANKTNTVPENSNLAVQKKVYRFLSEKDKNQFVLAVQSYPRPEHIKSTESLFLSNKISIYDAKWNQVANIDQPIKVDKRILSNPSLYLLEEPLHTHSAYISSELIDTTLNNTYIPGKINPKASAIVATSKRQKLHVPHLLNKEDTLLISDVVLGLDQPVNDKTRIPITPSVEHIYKPDTNLMVYFEAYNIPEEGYSFEYYFERHRWLFKNKRPEEKPSVTIINDELNDGRNSQLFSISLSDLEEGTYDLIFKFRPLSQNKQKMPLRTRKIKLVVDDNPRTS